MPRSKKRARESQVEDEKTGGGPRSFWSGTLSFGLVSIPVELRRATTPNKVSLRMLAPDGTPLERRFVCPEDEHEVPSDELVRGYEVAKGEHVPITDEELEAVEPEKSRDIDLRRFVPEGTIDPLYFDRPFFLTPAGDSSKAYRLLAATMQRTQRAGIASFVMQDREHLVAILADDGLLKAQLLRFQDEVRTPQDVGLPAVGKAHKPDRALVQQLTKVIEKHSEDALDTSELRDETVEKLRALVEKKAKNHQDVVEHEDSTTEPANAQILDLMETLKESLAQGKKRAS